MNVSPLKHRWDAESGRAGGPPELGSNWARTGLELGSNWARTGLGRSLADDRHRVEFLRFASERTHSHRTGSEANVCPNGR